MKGKLMEIKFQDNPEEENTALKEEVTETEDSQLKSFIVNYTGDKLNPEDDNVTVEMIIDVLADEFPEIVLPIAEENFFRGYKQALQDTEQGQKILSENEELSNRIEQED